MRKIMKKGMGKSMRKNMNRMMLAALVGLLTAGSSMSSMAATFSARWYQQGDGTWRIRNKEGKDVVNAWLCDDSVAENGKNVWYLLDPNGNMISGALVQDKTGNYYSLETEHNGYYGMLRTKNGIYNGVKLEFSQNHDGTFGAITNADGIAALTAAYGVKKADVDNSNICYTAAFEEGGKTAEKKTSGGGGGGSSSGGGGGSRSGGSSGGSSGSSSGGSSIGSSAVYNYQSTAENADDIYNINVAATSSYDVTYYSRYKSEIEAVIRDFKAQYIKPEMSDFEKEMKIIQYLVENVRYDYENYRNKTLDGYVYTTYGALVKNSAVCSGYASAFQRLAAACGIETRYVYNKTHAWNLIKLDGEWYHVDVTWEDPVPDNNYGFGSIRNQYINRVDDEIRNVVSHKTWSPDNIACNGYKYGPDTVAAYMATGKVDTSKAKSYAQKLQEGNAAQEKRLEAAGHVYDFTSVDEVAEKISREVLNSAVVGKTSVSYGIRFRGYDPRQTGAYTSVSNFKKEIESKVGEKLKNAVRKDQCLISCTVENAGIYGTTNGVSYTDYYVVTGSVKYNWDMAMNYTVNYVDMEGNIVLAQTGKAAESGIVPIQVPSGYVMLPNTDVRITSGLASVTADHKSITIKDRKPMEAVVQVYKNPIPYTIRYMFNGRELSVQSGTMAKDSRGGAAIQKPQGGYVMKEDDIVYKSGSGSWNLSNNTFSVTSYAPVLVEVHLHAQDGNDTELPTYGDIYNSSEVQEHYDSTILVDGCYGNILHSHIVRNGDMNAAAERFMKESFAKWMMTHKDQLTDEGQEYTYFFLNLKNGASFDEEELEVNGSIGMDGKQISYKLKAAYVKSFEYFGGTMQMWIAEAFADDVEEVAAQKSEMKSAAFMSLKVEKELADQKTEEKEETADEEETLLEEETQMKQETLAEEMNPEETETLFEEETLAEEDLAEDESQMEEETKAEEEASSEEKTLSEEAALTEEKTFNEGDMD